VQVLEPLQALADDVRHHRLFKVPGLGHPHFVRVVGVAACRAEAEEVAEAEPKSRTQSDSQPCNKTKHASVLPPTPFNAEHFERVDWPWEMGIVPTRWTKSSLDE
jgi:hypothetical protein